MKKALLLVAAVVFLVLALSSVALAATPQAIYDDYAANGKLTQDYTNADLRAYLDDATVHQYGDPTVVAGLDQLVTDLLGRGEFPFTGAQLALIAVAAVVLIGAGFGLRRVTRKRT